jgi:hypothetical protein
MRTDIKVHDSKPPANNPQQPSGGQALFADPIEGNDYLVEAADLNNSLRLFHLRFDLLIDIFCLFKIEFIYFAYCLRFVCEFTLSV